MCLYNYLALALCGQLDYSVECAGIVDIDLLTLYIYRGGVGTDSTRHINELAHHLGAIRRRCYRERQFGDLYGYSCYLNSASALRRTGFGEEYVDY